MAAVLFLGCAGSSNPDGGSPQDAGGGTPPVDAGPGDAGNLSVACPYTYCDNFDEYDAGPITNGELLGPWVATFQGTRTTMNVDPSGGYGGTQALRVTITYVDNDGGTVRATLNQKVTDGGSLVGPDLFGRAEIFYADVADGGLPLGVHSWVFNASGKIPDGGATSMNMGGGGNKLQLNYQYPPVPKYADGGSLRYSDGGAYPTESSQQGGAMTTGTWHCLQWEYNGSPNNMGNVWIDGTPAITVNNPTPVENWVISQGYTSFDFGFNHYQQLSNGIDVYLDNFALDSAMIPCP